MHTACGMPWYGFLDGKGGALHVRSACVCGQRQNAALHSVSRNEEEGVVRGAKD